MIYDIRSGARVLRLFRGNMLGELDLYGSEYMDGVSTRKET